MIHLQDLRGNAVTLRKITASFLAMAAAASLAACSQEPATEQATNEGEQIFERSCAACHGEEGRGPSMDDIRALPSDQLRAAIANHPRAGDVLDRLTAADIGDLVEYLDQ